MTNDEIMDLKTTLIESRIRWQTERGYAFMAGLTAPTDEAIENCKERHRIASERIAAITAQITLLDSHLTT